MPIFIEKVEKKDDTYYIQVEVRSACCSWKSILEFKHNDSTFFDINTCSVYKLTSDVGRLALDAIKSYDVQSKSIHD